MDRNQERLVYVSMANRTSDNMMIGDFGLEGAKAGEVEITHVGDGWLCGEARVQTESSRFAGKFAAKIL